MVEEYSIKILKKAIKDKEKIKQYPALKNNVNNLIEIIKKIHIKHLLRMKSWLEIWKDIF